MKTRPIIFSAPMVRAILDGRKTQTRRIVKKGQRFMMNGGPYLKAWHNTCQYGQPGDQLWVRETWAAPHSEDAWPASAIHCDKVRIHYAASEPLGGLIKRPSIHMPRSASRITLEITRVRVERLHDITEADAMAEGVERTVTGDGWHRYCEPAWEEVGVPPLATARQSYFTLWNQIHYPSTWTENPWVWVIEFRRVECTSA